MQILLLVAIRLFCLIVQLLLPMQYQSEESVMPKGLFLLIVLAISP